MMMRHGRIRLVHFLGRLVKSGGGQGDLLVCLSAFGGKKLKAGVTFGRLGPAGKPWYSNLVPSGS